MPTVFTTVCIDCNANINLPSTAIALVDVAGRVRYSYTCPACRCQTTRDADEEILGKFAKGGLRPRKVTAPEPPTIAGLPVSGPPICEDELIDFGLELYAP